MHAVSDSFKEFSHPCANQIKLGFQQVLTKLNGGDPKAKKKIFTDLKYECLNANYKRINQIDLYFTCNTFSGFAIH